MAQNRYRRAIGLQYDDAHDQTPRVAIKGDALDADEVVALARKYGVPVIERGQLAQALDRLEPGESIPEKLYRAVALILSGLERRWRR